MPDSVRSDVRFWDKIAPKYARSPISDEESYQQKLKLTQEYLRPEMNVLELGCGTGSTALIHAPFVKHILATDLSANMIAIAEDKRKEAGAHNVTFETADLDSFDPAYTTFDAVLALNLIHLLHDPAGAIARIHSLLKPGGVFVQSTACLADDMKMMKFILPVAQMLGKAPHVAFFSENALKTWMEAAGFRTLHHWKPGKGKATFIIAEKA